MAKSLSALKPMPNTYVKCMANPLKEPLSLGRFYKVLEGNKIKNDLGVVGHTLGQFEPLSESYLNAFK